MEGTLLLAFEKDNKGYTHTYIPGVSFCFWWRFRLENSGRAKHLLPGFLVGHPPLPSGVNLTGLLHRTACR